MPLGEVGGVGPLYSCRLRTFSRLVSAPLKGRILDVSGQPIDRRTRTCGELDSVSLRAHNPLIGSELRNHYPIGSLRRRWTPDLRQRTDWVFSQEVEWQKCSSRDDRPHNSRCYVIALIGERAGGSGIH